MTDEFDEFASLSDQALEQLEKDLEFDKAFYERLAGGEDLDVISIPDIDGRYLSLEEKNYILLEAKKQKAKILYRISLGRYAVVFAKNGDKIGLIPEDNPHGFKC